MTTVADLVGHAERRMRRARVFFGHGTDNARDEAVALVLHAVGLAHDAPPRAFARRVTAPQRSRVCLSMSTGVC
jgi:ribosomal protein L3 glutamine methyltransferase